MREPLRSDERRKRRENTAAEAANGASAYERFGWRGGGNLIREKEPKL